MAKIPFVEKERKQRRDEIRSSLVEQDLLAAEMFGRLVAQGYLTTCLECPGFYPSERLEVAFDERKKALGQ